MTESTQTKEPQQLLLFPYQSQSCWECDHVAVTSDGYCEIHDPQRND